MTDCDELSESPPVTEYDKLLSSVSVGSPKVIQVRKLVKMRGYKRRGAALVRKLTAELEAKDLVSEPEIGSADYYGTVTIIHRRDVGGVRRDPKPWPISSVLDVERQLTFVSQTASLPEVEATMIMKGYSQIPVLSGKRDLLGSVTWKSIALAKESKSIPTARHAMEAGGYVASSSDNMLLHVRAIMEREFIYIHNPEREIVGILTAADLGESFLKTAGPYIKLGEIEDRIRALIDQLPLSAISAAKHPDAPERDVNSAADLTFGEYLRAIEPQQNWSIIGILVDRKSALENLRRINKIRNDVMHFRPQGLEANQLREIDECLNWLRVA